MLRYALVIAILAFVMAALAEDRKPAPYPCSFVRPIHIRDLVEAMDKGCYIAAGTIIRVPVDDVYPGEPGYGEGEPVTPPEEPRPRPT